MQGVAYLGNGKAETRNYAKPQPRAGEVLIEVRAAGLCGSDLHKYHRDDAWARERKGMIVGHEGAGVVVELGPGVSDVSPVRIGERVSVYHSLGCGRCIYCLDGMPVFCDEEGAFGRTRDGTFAEYLVAPADCCLPLPEHRSFEAGAMLACTAGTAYAALAKTGLVMGEVCVVFGLGPVGLTVISLASSLGLECIGVEINEYRIDLARRLIACPIINPAEEDVVAAVDEKTSGDGAPGVVECSGRARGRATAVDIASRRGTVVLVGVGDREVPVNPERIIRSEITIRGNAVYSTSDYFRALKFLDRNGVDLDALITHRFPIDRAVEAFETFDSGSTGKVILSFDH